MKCHRMFLIVCIATSVSSVICGRAILSPKEDRFEYPDVPAGYPSRASWREDISLSRLNGQEWVKLHIGYFCMTPRSGIFQEYDKSNSLWDELTRVVQNQQKPLKTKAFSS